MTNFKTLALATFAVVSLSAGAAMAQEGSTLADTYWSSPAVPSATAHAATGATQLHSSSFHVNTTRYNPNQDEPRNGTDSNSE